MRSILLLLLSALAHFPVKAQDTLKVRKVKVLPVPAFGYAPETRYYVGAVSLFTMDFYNRPDTRKSTGKVEFNYTWNRQVILEGELNYFFREEKWFTSSSAHYSKYPDQYFGIGAATSDSNRVLFQSNRLKLDATLCRQIGNKLFLGGGARYVNYTHIAALSEHAAAYPELVNSANAELKFLLFKDTRNNLLTPVHGEFYELISGINYTGNQLYLRIVGDARKYYSFGKNKSHVLAGRAFHTSVIGNAPFYDLAILGGDRIARGYFYGRFRDDHLSTLQVEYRTPYLWRLGLAGFGGVSVLYGPRTAFDGTNLKPNAGIGLRFLVDKTDRTNLRFDYAVGANGQSGFYVSFGESF